MADERLAQVAPTTSTGFGLPVTFETVTKALTALAVICYALGYAIVTIYNAAHGLPDPNPLRPKLAYSGFIFLLLTVIPSAATFPIVRDLFRAETRKLFIVTWLLSYSILSLMMASAAWFLFDFTYKPDVMPHNKLALATLLMVLFSTTWLTIYFQNWERAVKLKQPLWLILLLLVNMSLMFYTGWPGAEFNAAQVRLWFFVSGVLGGYLGNAMWHPEHRRKLDLPITAFYVFFLLSIYPVLIYPHIKSAFGGGSLRPIRVYFSATPSSFTCEQVNADLIEQADDGFYVQLSDQRTLFLPRTSIDAVSFLQKPLPPELSASCVKAK
jgi:hypothetical protein